MDVLAGQLHNTEFRIDSCSPDQQSTLGVQKKNQVAVVLPSGGVQFDSAQPKISGGGILSSPTPKTVEVGGKQ